MIFLVGSRGRLGCQISAEYGLNNVVSLSRAIYQDWTSTGKDKLVLKYFKDRITKGSIIFVTSGLLDPSSSKESLFEVNYNLPKNIIKGTSDLGVKVVTFGTVMEDNIAVTNSYIQSKLALSKFIAASPDKSLVLHIKVHTLYGLGEPSSFMFLGQIFTAICNDQLFKMTSGAQLREYHHIIDEVKAIKELVEKGHSGALVLSHGNSVSLKDIAEAIFKRMDKEHLLRIGAIPEPTKENYHLNFNRNDFVKLTHFRDSIPAIANYMHNVCDPLGP